MLRNMLTGGNQIDYNLSVTEVYSKPCQTSKMEYFVKI